MIKNKFSFPVFLYFIIIKIMTTIEMTIDICFPISIFQFIVLFFYGIVPDKVFGGGARLVIFIDSIEGTSVFSSDVADVADLDTALSLFFFWAVGAKNMV